MIVSAIFMIIGLALIIPSLSKICHKLKNLIRRIETNGIHNSTGRRDTE